MKTRQHRFVIILALSALAGAVATRLPAQEPERSIGQKLYVPVYSEIPLGVGRRTIRLSAILSIRNVDPRRSIVITAADYYGTTGDLIHRYLSEPRTLGPLASMELVVIESDLRGGVSASFVVEWRAQSATHPPLVETIMLGTAGAQGISFVGQSRVIEERRP